VARATVDTRERILDVSAELLRRHGYAGTGLKRVVTAAGAQLGSLYHFFPGGKEELAIAVIHREGQRQLEYLDGFFVPPAGSADSADPADSTDPADPADPAAAIDAYFADTLRTLRASGFTEACPITLLALEAASDDGPLRRAVAEVFETWIDLLGRRLTGAGIPPAPARALAVTVLTEVEGAFVLARAARATEPVDVARARVVAAIRAARADAVSARR